MTSASATDGRIRRGERSRAAVLKAAADLATIDGIDGLSIAAVAERAGMSKAGVAGLFGSKLALQLATVRNARDIFVDEVMRDALRVQGGIDRILALTDASLHYSEHRVFEGGCFFAATSAELASRPGPVRDAVADQMHDWYDSLRRVVQRAVDLGEFDGNVDVVAFELAAIVDGANRRSLLYGSAEPYAQARAAIRRVLGR